MPKNDQNNYKSVNISIFGIEVDTTTFTTGLLQI